MRRKRGKQNWIHSYLHLADLFYTLRYAELRTITKIYLRFSSQQPSRIKDTRKNKVVFRSTQIKWTEISSFLQIREAAVVLTEWTSVLVLQQWKVVSWSLTRNRMCPFLNTRIASYSWVPVFCSLRINRLQMRNAKKKTPTWPLSYLYLADPFRYAT